MRVKPERGRPTGLKPGRRNPRDHRRKGSSTGYLVGLAMKKSTIFGLTCNSGDGAYQWSGFKWWVR